MNLLALLERRMPPEIPMGAGRFISFDQEPQPVVAAIQARAIHRTVQQMESRRKILGAIQSGQRLIKEIKRYTGLCKTSVFNHCNALATEGQIEISSINGVNTYTLAKPKPAPKGAK